MKLPPPPGPHFAADELFRIATLTTRLPCETERRAIHHLALLCPKCWAAVDDLPPLKGVEGPNGVGVGLANLELASPALLCLRANHRLAIANARRQPLGFCRLVLEAIWTMACYRRFGKRLPEFLRFTFGPMLANGALLFAPREAHDLQAQFFILLGHGYCQVGDTPRAADAAAQAEAHLAEGKGQAEPRASLLELEAVMAFLQREPDRGAELYEEAEELLKGYDPPDRQPEVLLLQASALATTNQDNRIRAAAILRKALAIVDQLAGSFNPALHNSLTLELAAIEGGKLISDPP